MQQGIQDSLQGHEGKSACKLGRGEDNMRRPRNGLWMEDMPLTARQDKMMELISQGYTYEEIGKIMHWADTTIRRTLSLYIFPKLRACNKAQAIANWVWLHVLRELKERKRRENQAYRAKIRQRRAL
jgi:ATP/maltotriose-dependent transcriptional regulator MalT